MARKKPEAKEEKSVGEKIADVIHDVVDAVVHSTSDQASKSESAQAEETQPDDMANHPKFDKFK